ncbi:hypothetical protein AC579_1277 [Pseudocercospora musae]|uniref:Ubiquitin 3 binding protein But2 C-terminal domain-containing protein n=1 Tax=Pseudocercospora musae TaxID=113226 RepID=A0A139IHJ5_9PEZI|nr:hypothetical protein AC579_1277 [Pseudocercospora musae]
MPGIHLTLLSIFLWLNGTCLAQIITDQVIGYANPKGLTLEIDDPQLAPEIGYESNSSLLIRFEPAPGDLTCFNIDDIPAGIAEAQASGSDINATLSERGTYSSSANYSQISFAAQQTTVTSRKVSAYQYYRCIRLQIVPIGALRSIFGTADSPMHQKQQRQPHSKAFRLGTQHQRKGQRNVFELVLKKTRHGGEHLPN